MKKKTWFGICMILWIICILPFISGFFLTWLREMGCVSGELVHQVRALARVTTPLATTFALLLGVIDSGGKSKKQKKDKHKIVP